MVEVIARLGDGHTRVTPCATFHGPRAERLEFRAYVAVAVAVFIAAAIAATVESFEVIECR